MTSQYPPDSQYDWRSAQFQHCNMFSQGSYNQDYSRSDYTALLETNYALAQAQIAQVQINQATAFSRMKEENSYPPTAHTQLQNNNVCKDKTYASYPPVAHSSVGLSQHLHKSKMNTNPNSNSPNLTQSTNIILPMNNQPQIGSNSYNWMKNEDWGQNSSSTSAPTNFVTEQHQIQNYYHQNAQRNYWS